MKPARTEILLITPPMMQLNAAYPAAPNLTGFLRAHGYNVAQADASLELALRLFSRAGLKAIRRELTRSRKIRARPETVRIFLKKFGQYADTVGPAIRFLQGREIQLAQRIVTRRFLPEGPRFDRIGEWNLDMQDQAKHLASLYVDDLADVIKLGVDARFELSRYAEKLALSLPRFEPLQEELAKPPTLVDRMIEKLAAELVAAHHPKLVGFTIPFPGNLYAALRMARRMKHRDPGIRIVLGGGYVNTELRSLTDPGIFDFVDFITLDDGEMPLLRLIEHLEKKTPADRLIRTFIHRNGRVLLLDSADKSAGVPPAPIVPAFDGLRMEERIGMMELPNPVYRLWSDGRWNKLMLAHGCYWRRCAFCDTSLDYIRDFRPESAGTLADRIEAVMKQTGQSGFHFVDEAAPPALLRAVAGEILRRRLVIRWWGNIRFEKNFTPELARRLADSGCIALTGGLETVCDRTLALMRKGITVEEAVRVAGYFFAQGIRVHAYLMYGFPSQTVQETVDALEIVRQMFDCGCIQSAYWHRFALTVHSPMARSPAKFGIRLLPTPPAPFAQNEIPFEDLSGCDPEPLAPGLRKAVYNFMHGVGFDQDVRNWFDVPVPRPRTPRQFVEQLLSA